MLVPIYAVNHVISAQLIKEPAMPLITHYSPFSVNEGADKVSAYLFPLSHDNHHVHLIKELTMP